MEQMTKEMNAMHIKSVLLRRDIIDIQCDKNRIRNVGIYGNEKASFEYSHPIHIEDNQQKSSEIEAENIQLDETIMLSQQKEMGTFLCQYKTYKRNYLTANPFVIVYKNDTLDIISGTVQAQSDAGNIYYSISSKNTLINNYLPTCFVSSPLQTENNKYLFLSQKETRPIFDQGHHTERLAFDTLRSNPDIFFDLIRQTAHRQDLPIVGMGVAYCSSYDSCNECFKELYTKRETLSKEINHIANHQGYKKINKDEVIPLYTLFYADKAYKDTTYTLHWEESSKKMRRDVTYDYRKKPDNCGNDKNLDDNRYIALQKNNIMLNENHIYVKLNAFQAELKEACFH